jgi:hypothetical protein
VALSIEKNGISREVAIQLFSAYDEFLKIMSDSEKRQHLKDLRVKDSRTDPVFREVTAVSDQFACALHQIFFKADALSPLTEKYGVF